MVTDFPHMNFVMVEKFEAIRLGFFGGAGIETGSHSVA